MKKNNWHLRVSVTDNCNFRCVYCNPEGLKSNKPTISADEIFSILKAAKNNNIESVHWTGGEPTIFKDGDYGVADLVQYAKEIGFTDQVMTTNGALFHKIIDDLYQAGLNRVNVSIDSIDGARNYGLTGRDNLDDTKRSLEQAVQYFKQTTKMNIVAMQDTVKEFPLMVAYAKELSDASIGNIAIKLIEICPNNPAQLQKEGEEFYRDQHIGRSELMDAMSQVGDLKLLPIDKIEGDNPNARYYEVGDTGVAVGFVTMPSTNWSCGRDYCHKFRITPYGGAAICLQKPIEDLRGLDDLELEHKIKALMDDRMTLDSQIPDRIHYRPQLGEMRFGDINGSLKIRPAEYFIELCKRNV